MPSVRHDERHASDQGQAARSVLELAARLADEDLTARLIELERRAERWTDGTSGLVSIG